MASLARASPYARRLSLFYSVFAPYRLKQDDPADLKIDGPINRHHGLDFDRIAAAHRARRRQSATRGDPERRLRTGGMTDGDDPRQIERVFLRQHAKMVGCQRGHVA